MPQYSLVWDDVLGLTFNKDPNAQIYPTYVTI